MSPIVRQFLSESSAAAAESSTAPKMVVKKTRPQEYFCCPHCDAELFEHHTYWVQEEDQEYCSACKNPIDRPPTNWDGVSPEWRALLKPYCDEREARRQQRRRNQ